jgi:predicted RNA binding protein YcfA (HicA-like mRNA interferase family)
MRLPRDLDADNLISLLRRYGYKVTRQTGSHIRLTTLQGGEHHVTIPHHKSLRVGTLQAVLQDIAQHLGLNWPAFLEELFGRKS